MADIRPLELLLADGIGCYLRQQTVKSWLVEPRHGRRLAYRTTDRITDLVDASDQGLEMGAAVAFMVVLCDVTDFN